MPRRKRSHCCPVTHIPMPLEECQLHHFPHTVGALQWASHRRSLAAQQGCDVYERVLVRVRHVRFILRLDHVRWGASYWVCVPSLPTPAFLRWTLRVVDPLLPATPSLTFASCFLMTSLSGNDPQFNILYTDDTIDIITWSSVFPCICLRLSDLELGRTSEIISFGATPPLEDAHANFQQTD